MRARIAAIASVLLLAACDKAPTMDLGAIADLAPTGPPMMDLALVPCSDPDPPDGGVCPISVSGRVVEGGGAVEGLVVSVCAGLCFFGKTATDGTFSVTPDAHIRVAEYALELHGRPDRVSYYTPLPPLLASTITFAAPLPLPLLPAAGPTIADDGSAQMLTSGDLTLILAAGTKVLFNVEDFGTANGHQLRVLPIASPTQLPFVDPKQPPDALYACSPFEVAFDHKAQLKLANRANLPAGSAVEVLSMVGLVNDAPPAGHLVHAAVAHVSSDGTTLTTDPGEGVTELTWIALKKI